MTTQHSATPHPATGPSPEITAIQQRFGDQVVAAEDALECAEITISRLAIVDVCHFLRSQLAFEQLIDICGVDLSEFPEHRDSDPRFEVVYHLLSVTKNRRIRLKVAVDERELVDSVTEVWPVANWYEREAFDMYGIIFNHHPDLRRLLTDYGFEGHPLRKDFPVTGRVEMFFDESQWRCIYRPNKVENRVLIPKVWPEEHNG
ncbi:MAG: NADH-quinone oxidoreductase subunit C [Mariprofundales bacterium]|nr:NADH-quinone oxidoreductase subunit C [Mariprofundales bacterium]